MATSLEQPQIKPARSIPHPATTSNRGLIFLHALAFVLGFTLVFTLLGSALGLFGQRLTVYQDIFQRFGAIMLVIFGLTTLGVFRWLSHRIRQSTDLATNPAAAALVSILEFFNNLLYSEKRVTEMHKVSRKWGFLSSALLGVSFSAGWVPCIGPILSSILVMASSSARVGEGATLLAIYSLGLGIPFLITGAAFSSATTFLRRLNRHTHIVSIISGIFLFYVAYLLWSDTLVLLTARFTGLTNWLLDLEYAAVDASAAESTVSNMTVAGGAPLAFFAGLLSFLSPCVLPLVPAYIGFLSSAAVGNSSAKE
ncbi:MAG: sulfite exporter TauE/SafE family protein [Caldilineaceae bacterium]|nr:sulfite exporter TauE/SafE family protein [Caldilineaceae bacterium]